MGTQLFKQTVTVGRWQPVEWRSCCSRVLRISTRLRELRLCSGSTAAGSKRVLWWISWVRQLSTAAKPAAASRI
ncbi:hypothetical protein LINPERPRIM_LOCUS15789 [Linum perenne]